MSAELGRRSLQISLSSDMPRSVKVTAAQALTRVCCAQAQARAKHQGIEQIALQPQVRGYGAVVERARQGRHEVDAAA